MDQLRFDSVTYSWPALAEPPLCELTFSAAVGWTGVVGANGVGKSTLLGLAVGALAPITGTVTAPAPAVYCEQRTDHVPGDLAELLCFPDADAGRLASVLGLGADWPYRWETLSHGERKRAQIAVALWRRPELLAIDEPTNHLDRGARKQLCDALASYRGVGLIVSHDRELLDRLCRQCLFLNGPRRAVVRPGGVSEGLVQQERERLETRRTHDRAQADVRRLASEAARRRSEASGQDRRRSKRGLARGDSDAREKIDRARLSGADGQAGRLANQLDGRLAGAEARLREVERPVQERVGISVHGRRARGDVLVRTGPGRLELPDGRIVKLPELTVGPEDRIALQGPNGAGKSTLIGRLLGELDRPGRVLSIPQEIDESGARHLVDRVRASDRATLGRVISTVSRLGSDPEKLLATALPSPGETRKLMLAVGLEQEPSLIVMDEPTNHLDLVSMTCIEEALAAFEGALLLVSHDEHFVRALTRTRWAIDGDHLKVSAMPA